MLRKVSSVIGGDLSSFLFEFHRVNENLKATDLVIFRQPLISSTSPRYVFSSAVKFLTSSTMLISKSPMMIVQPTPMASRCERRSGNEHGLSAKALNDPKTLF